MPVQCASVAQARSVSLAWVVSENEFDHGTTRGGGGFGSTIRAASGRAEYRPERYAAIQAQAQAAAAAARS